MSNPIHSKRLFEVWGSGTQEAADKWDTVMRELYACKGIRSQRKLSAATGVPENTLQSSGAFKTPHTMTYRTFIRICRALNADDTELINAFMGYDPQAAANFDSAYEGTKERVNELLAAYLTLSESAQRTVLQMVRGIEAEERSNKLHAAACGLLAEQLGNVVSRCKSWDYIDLD